ncbi:hypothetical protein M407DRAFT_21095 [Tulasnella calospora MUT 4182]|uniref:Uncharacterized protein n=1 Tax=Tulasnella calospora MUT 4182 TaxID=1051891 RepID=A0A0C3M861_9AGAM|nr:hypothetical protein M407DRAFT_21095 [Tulasnella calospora MUT 4182]
MDSLPVELLSRIFINVLPPHLDDPRYEVEDPGPAQASICCVCQRWNQVAKSTPSLWTFIKIWNRIRSHDVMKRRLELSGNLPLNVMMWLCQDQDEEQFSEIHALLAEQFSRWNTLRVKATVDVPSALQQWVPSVLPNVVGLSLSIEVLEEVSVDDMDSREPFISAPHLTFCSSDSPVLFPLTHCPLLREYRAIGIGFDGFEELERGPLWMELVSTLSRECPQLEVLQVSEEGNVYGGSVSLEDWPALPSLTTLRFAIRPSYPSIRCVITGLRAPKLHLVEFRGLPVVLGFDASDLSIPEMRLPEENHGRILFSGIEMSHLTSLLQRIPNATDLDVEVDLASIIDGDPTGRQRGVGTLGLSSAVISDLRRRWEWVQKNIPKVSWLVPSEKGGGLERLGGADLLFDDAIAHLDNRMGAQLNIQNYYKDPASASQNYRAITL